ncbi:Krueppel homolog 1 [Eupeodes corollae]|uniref:Krueppel homolog 1 n=1 Tax=Eupeodes corollae TaxID=290404 RepID=UPI0024901423|nr:Krueppel homolog 1 [Eupeodes corollae]
MVYYPALPLVMKTEPMSQSEFCLPLTSSSGLSDSQMYQQTNMIVQQPITSIRNRIGGGIGGVPPSASSSSSPPSSSATTISGETLLISPHDVQTFQISNGQNITIYTTTTQTPTESISPTQSTSSASSAATTTATNNGRKSSPASVKSTTSPTKPQFKCEQCGMTFGSKSAHTSHTKSHAKIEGAGGVAMVSQQHQINEIPAGIPKTPQIKANGSGSDPYQCNVCQKTFAVPARLIRHYRTHTGERPFECEFCHKLFSVKENLQVHRRIHTKERPYKCDVCGRAFEHSGKLHRHMRIHTGERPHKCSVCGKTFIQSGQLVIHMRTHTGEKPYKCPVEGCGKGFTCSKQLKVHSRTHTGEKPYHCDICFRDFGYNHVLKLHRVQHYGSKCYKCTICDETFKSKKEMEAHIKGHANEIPDDEENPSGSSNNQQQAPSSPISMVVKQDPLSPSSPSSSSIILETDQSRDSGVAISTSGSCNNTGSSSTSLDEMPPEIQAELQQQNHHKRHQKQKQQLQQLLDDQQPQAKEMISFSNVYHRYQARSASPSDEHQDQHHQSSPDMLIPQYVGRPTINPALLEAASLASRRVLEEDTLKNGRRINSRNETEDLRSSSVPRQSYYTPAPVGEFRSSLPANDIVRQVEAAIAGAGLSPLRSASSASPERSSSPESDSMMMADRDVMTLPLRKRKLYLKDNNQSSKTEVPKVMRMSSVIQFAKAS